jgi:hypothetical protein
MKPLISVLIAGSIGVAAGAMAVRAWQPDVPPLPPPAPPATSVPEGTLEVLREARTRLEAENTELRQQLAALRAAQQAYMPAAPPPAEPETLSMDRLLGAIAGSPAAIAEQLAEARVEQRREEWRSRREEFTRNFEQGMNDFFADAIANSPDPEDQQRLALLQQSVQDMMALRRQREAAQSEEERERYDAAMRAAREETQRLVREHQDKLLRDTLQSAGIEGNKQDRVLKQLRRTMESPFFSSGYGGLGPSPWRGGDRGDRAGRGGERSSRENAP